MSDINIDDFCRDTARVLTTLYSVFPRPHTLFVEDICGAHEPDEFGVHGARHLTCFHTMLWLADENFIRFADSIRQEAVDQAVLTGRCFSLLCSAPGSFTLAKSEEEADDLPESVRLARTMTVNQLTAALRSRSSNQIRGVVFDLLDRMNRLNRN